MFTSKKQDLSLPQDSTAVFYIALPVNPSRNSQSRTTGRGYTPKKPPRGGGVTGECYLASTKTAETLHNLYRQATGGTRNTLRFPRKCPNSFGSTCEKCSKGSQGQNERLKEREGERKELAVVNKQHRDCHQFKPWVREAWERRGQLRNPL